jgi:HEAT repeat protein
LLIAALAWTMALAEARPPAEAALDRLIRQLESDDFDEREAAAAALVEAGQPALSRLRRARDNPSLDFRRRAAAIEKAIRDRLQIAPFEVVRFQGHSLWTARASFSSTSRSEPPPDVPSAWPRCQGMGTSLVPVTTTSQSRARQCARSPRRSAGTR